MVTQRLKDLKYDKARVNILRQRRDDLTLDNGLKGICYEGDRVQTSPSFDQVEVQAIKNIEIEQQLDRQISRLSTRIYELEQALLVLDAEDRKIVEMYYIDNKQIKAIAYELNMCYKTCQERKRKAMEILVDLVK